MFVRRIQAVAASRNSLIPAMRTSPSALVHRHHLHGGVAHFVQKIEDDGAAQEQVEARTGRLPEDDVRDRLTFGEGDQRFADPLVLKRDNLRAKTLR